MLWFLYHDALENVNYIALYQKYLPSPDTLFETQTFARFPNYFHLTQYPNITQDSVVHVLLISFHSQKFLAQHGNLSRWHSIYKQLQEQDKQFLDRISGLRHKYNP